MKQLVELGSTVDDLSGDYLRVGGTKINNNFEEAYFELGDGDKFHAAGAWKTHKGSDSGTLNVEFGDAWIVDTSGGLVTVMLPQNPTPLDYGKVIKIKDVIG